VSARHVRLARRQVRRQARPLGVSLLLDLELVLVTAQ